MNDYKLGEIERRFADIVWDNEPLSSGQLTQLCAQRLDWKKSTTYTVLKNLCNEGIFQNENAVVVSKISQEQYLEQESTQIVNNRFDGSISKFVTAFAKRKKLSEKQIEELKKIIEDCES